MLTKFSGSCILLVEDNEINQDLAYAFLKEAGVLVNVATNGAEAVEMITNGDVPFDLVLMDIQMPVMDGYEATRRIRADGRFVALPIVAMTDQALQDERQKVIQVGMSDYITKPIDKAGMSKIMSLYANHKNCEAHVSGRVNTYVSKLCRIPGLDVIAVLDRLGGNINLYLDILKVFADNHAGSATLIEKALNEGDFALAERLIHTLKGNADTIGALIVRDVALLLEKTIRQNDPPEKVHGVLEFLTQELEVFVRILLRELPAVDNDVYYS